MPFLFFLASLIFGAGTAGLGMPFSSPTQPVDTVKINPCYQLEENIKVTVDEASLTSDDCRTQLDSKTYLRIRQQIKIINSKIGEGIPHTGTCVKDVSRLRKIGLSTDGREAWWLDKNHLNDNTESFIFIFLEKNQTHHLFDVYIDESEKDKLKDDPKYEFIRNCQETGGLVPVVEGPATPLFPPQIISLTDSSYNQNANQRFDTDGFKDNFNAHLAEYSPYYIRIEEKIIPDPAEQIGIFAKTIPPETKTYDVFYHAGIVYLKDQNNNKNYMYNPSEELPPFANPRNPSLQLTAMKFVTTSEWTWATPECKPALYLYPEKPTMLTVKLKPKGELTFTDPVYDPQKGWEVIAFPDGNLEIRNSKLEIRNYPYLYYEAEIEKVKTPNKGWVVKNKDLESLFKKILPRLGLNQKETQEFISYWLSVLNNSPYYFIGLIDQQEIERIEPIEFSKPPDTFIRVRLFFEPLEKSVSVEPPHLPPPPSRPGFVAVDWGGILSSGTCQGGEALNTISR